MIFFRFLLLIAISWMMGFVWFINQMNIHKPNLTYPFDAAVVLTGAKGRINTGVELLWKNKVKHLFISGVGQNVTLSELGKHIKPFTDEQLKTLENRISLGHFANSTEENALETMDWVRNKKFKKIILVTSNYHMPRSLYMFKHFMPDIEIIPYTIHKNSLSLELALLEYNKYLFSVFYKTYVDDKR